MLFKHEYSFVLDIIMDIMEWFFNGLGTALVSLIGGLVTGGILGYRIGVNKTKIVNQKQRARDNASQIQIGNKHEAISKSRK